MAYARNPNYRRRRKSYDMSKFRSAWVRTSVIKLMVHEYNIQAIKRDIEAKAKAEAEAEEREIPDELKDDEEDAESWDPDDATVYLSITDAKNHEVNLNLSYLTWPELLSVKSIIDLAFHRAAPAVRARDRKAANDARLGKFVHPRLYRQLPEHIIRKRILLGHGEGIRVGSEDILGGKFLPEDFNQSGDAGPDMAKPLEKYDGSKDSGTPIDLSQIVLEVGDQGDGAVPPFLSPPDGSGS